MSQVDEFGRAIPHGTGGGSESSDAAAVPPPYTPHNHHGGLHHRNEHRSLTVPRGPPRYSTTDHYHGSGPPAAHHHHHHLSSSSSSHHPTSHHHPLSHHHGGGGGPPLSLPPPPHWSRGGRGGGGPPRRGGGGGPPPMIKRGDSPIPSAAAVTPAGVASTSGGLAAPLQQPRPQSPTSSVASSSQPLPHPSSRYVAEPMLCGFLWKEQEGTKTTNPEEEEEKAVKTEDENNDRNDERGDDENENDEEEEATKKAATAASAADPEKSSTDAGEENNNNNKISKSYDDYRLEYAWTFLKHFFNQHLDDSWFRQSFSPALQVEGAQLERRRCHAEAQFLRQELQGNNNNNNNNTTTMTGFSLTLSSSSSPMKIPLGHLPSSKGRILHVHNVPPHVTDEHIRQALLPSLTDILVAQMQEQNKQQGGGGGGASKRRVDKKINPSHQEVLEQTLFGLFSSTPYNTHTVPTLASANLIMNNNTTTARNIPITAATPRGGSVFLHRSVFCILMSDKILQSLWQHLSQRDSTPEEVPVAATAAATATTTATPLSTTGDVHVPRKQDEKAAAMAAAAASSSLSLSSSTNMALLDLDVDCTDPYGRTEYDANGRGGPPPDGLAVPPRKAVIQISRYDAMVNASTLKLSVALSSPTRFASDHEAAQTIARALDVRHHVPVEDRLDSILEQCMDNNDNNNNNNSELLDISLAYLRRVHLYSFYKTTKAESFGDMLSGRSAAAQVQLRDEPLLEGVDSSNDFKDDLLGQRLNDSIRQTLDVDCHKWIAAADFYVDEATDAAAQEIAELEERATEDWLHKHLMDDDGRARCSFHFCHKLFKDESFLSKHLLKKHAAYNHAERAKCHDKYMMSTWENAPLRPAVPFVLVDCGKQFGKQEAALSGGPEPRATDPEPALWERKQYQEKLLLERQELRSKRPDHHASSLVHSDYNHHHRPLPPSSSLLQQALPSGPRTPKPAFVDVDDMKDETVQVSFDEVQLPSPAITAAGKKKKRKKLL